MWLVKCRELESNSQSNAFRDEVDNISNDSRCWICFLNTEFPPIWNMPPSVCLEITWPSWSSSPPLQHFEQQYGNKIIFLTTGKSSTQYKQDKRIWLQGGGQYGTNWTTSWTSSMQKGQLLHSFSQQLSWRTGKLLLPDLLNVFFFFFCLQAAPCSFHRP